MILERIAGLLSVNIQTKEIEGLDKIPSFIKSFNGKIVSIEEDGFPVLIDGNDFSVGKRTSVEFYILSDFIKIDIILKNKKIFQTSKGLEMKDIKDEDLKCLMNVFLLNEDGRFDLVRTDTVIIS